MNSCRLVTTLLATVAWSGPAPIASAEPADAAATRQRIAAAANAVPATANDRETIAAFFRNLAIPEATFRPGEMVPFNPLYRPSELDRPAEVARESLGDRWQQIPSLQAGIATLIRDLGRQPDLGRYQPKIRDPLVLPNGEPATFDPWCVAIARLPSDVGSEPIVWCSGVVIAPNAILTARHCCSVVHDLGRQTVDRVPAGPAADLARFVVSAGPRMAVGQGRRIKAIELQFIGKAGGNKPCEDAVTKDIAVIVFEDDLPKEFKPVRIARKDLLNEYLGRGNVIRVVGYGMANSRLGDLSAITIGTQYSAYVAGTAVLCAPGQPPQPWLRECEPDQFMVSPTLNGIAAASGADSCRGDSGGAAVIETAEGPQLVGLVSRAAVRDLDGAGIAACGKGGIYTRVDAYIDWLIDTVRYVPPGGDPGNPVVIRWSPAAPCPRPTSP